MVGTGIEALILPSIYQNLSPPASFEKGGSVHQQIAGFRSRLAGFGINGFQGIEWSDSRANLRLSSRDDLECKWAMGTVGDQLGMLFFLIWFDGKYYESRKILDI